MVEKAIARGPALARSSLFHSRRASSVMSPDSVSVAMRGKHPGASAAPAVRPTYVAGVSSLITPNIADGGVSTGIIVAVQAQATIARASKVRRRPYCSQSTGVAITMGK